MEPRARHSLAPKTFAIRLLFAGFLLAALPACTRYEHHVMLVTAYCPCSECCNWERGFPNFWTRRVAGGPSKGKPYTGKTASGVYPQAQHPGLLSADSLWKPWMIPIRLVCPWLILPSKGSIAADTNYYPFKTEIHVPGYGWGEVQDRGSAILGPDRLDLFYTSHEDALKWGRQRVRVRIKRP